MGACQTKIWQLMSFSLQHCVKLLRPSRTKILAQKLWSAVIPERIGLERQWKHTWVRGKARNPMYLTNHLFRCELFKKNPYLCICHTHFSKKLEPHIPFSFSDPDFALRRRLKTQEQVILKKVSSGCFGEA